MQLKNTAPEIGTASREKAKTDMTNKTKITS